VSLIYNGTSSAVIDASGDYTIDRDMTQTDPALPCVLINPGVNYVNLRLRSRLVYGGPTSGASCGIKCASNAAVTIIGDGGSIYGFPEGIRMDACYLAKIFDIAIQSALHQGIVLTGDDVIIKGCDVRSIGGWTGQNPSRNFGIQVSGVRPTIINNQVEQVTATEEAIGISVSDQGIDGVIAFNVIRCLGAPPPPLSNGNPASYGIWVGGASKVSDELNLVEGWAIGAAYSSPPSGDYGGNRYVNCTKDTLINSTSVVLSQTD
jgi:hypothetical protein